jgi:hypothetical protein
MMKQVWAPALLGLLTLIACGGGGVGQSSVSGLVFDIDGNPVRGARVYVDQGAARETLTTTSGSYRLEGVSAVDLPIRATVVKNGVTYTGQNVARVFSNDPTANINITVSPQSQQAAIRGTVFGSNGARLQNARISVRPTTGAIYSSTQTLTDLSGNYELTGLAAGLTYEVNASFPNFSAQDAVRTLGTGTVTTLNFSLGTTTDPLLPTPGNLGLVAWTSPAEVTRSRETAAAISGVKKFIDNRYRTQDASRLTALGNQIEIQLYWDRIDNSQLLGYALYRRRNNDAWIDLDFLRDPLAESYVDTDVTIRENVTWNYSVSAANSRYPDTNNSLSDFSDAVGVAPLGDMIDRGVTTSGGTVTFNWNNLPGAANTTVFVFDEYPGVTVSSYANNFSNPSTGTSFVYNLRPLATGQRYYYLIMGSNSDDSARSLTAIGSFIAP